EHRREPGPLAGRAPPGPGDDRHGRHRSLLPRRAGRPAGGHPRHRGLPSLLLRDRARRHARVLRVHRPARRALRQAGRGAVPAGVTVRPPVAAPRRRGRPLPAPAPPEGARLRGDRRDRPRHHAVHLLQRQQRDRARGVVVDGRPDGPARRPRRRPPLLGPGPGPRGGRAAGRWRARAHGRHPAGRRDHEGPLQADV
ncbi:MAG: hypothetical protein AVDCRST_MAG20-918, partial [uncultured Acidimicrobiales bacterium]